MAEKIAKPFLKWAGEKGHKYHCNISFHYHCF